MLAECLAITFFVTVAVVVTNLARSSGCTTAVLRLVLAISIGAGVVVVPDLRALGTVEGLPAVLAERLVLLLWMLVLLSPTSESPSLFVCKESYGSQTNSCAEVNEKVP
jgi:hypothetical protein